MSLNSLKSVVTVAPFAVLNSLPLPKILQCIFYFILTNVLIGFPLCTSFILTATFLLVLSKNSGSSSLDPNKCLKNYF